MKQNTTLIAVIVIIALVLATGLYAFTVWQKGKNKAGNIDQDKLFSLIASGFGWLNADYANNLVAKGRNDKVANAMYNYTPSQSSQTFI